MSLITWILIYNALYIICECGYRFFGMQELWRKIAHIGTGLITFVSTYFLAFHEYSILFGFFFVSFLIIRRYHILRVFDGKWRWFGDLYFIFGQLIAIFFLEYDRNITEIWLLILTLADGLAPFGRRIWDKKIIFGKTYGWSLLFSLITLLILWYYFWFSLIIIPTLLFAVSAELLWYRGTDNILIPIFVCLSLFFLW